MPFVSKAQRKFMHARHPEIAAQWDKEFPNQKGLPKRAKKKGLKCKKKHKHLKKCM